MRHAGNSVMFDVFKNVGPLKVYGQNMVYRKFLMFIRNGYGVHLKQWIVHMSI